MVNRKTIVEGSGIPDAGPSEWIEVSVERSVALLRLNDPEALNGLATPMIRELLAALERISAPDSGIRCAVLTGAGRAFCSGANLARVDPQEMLDSDGQLDLGRPLDEAYHPLLRALRDLPFPLITAVNGIAAGGGMSLAMMGDLVLAAQSASFLQAFRHRGLSLDCGASFLLPRLVGFGRALELSLLGEKLAAGKALEWGLVNRVYPDAELMDRAMELAHELAQGPTVALGLMRRAYWASRDNDFETQLSLERALQREAGRTQDFVEATRAFRKKRTPQFVGH